MFFVSEILWCSLWDVIFTLCKELTSSSSTYKFCSRICRAPHKKVHCHVAAQTWWKEDSERFPFGSIQCHSKACCFGVCAECNDRGASGPPLPDWSARDDRFWNPSCPPSKTYWTASRDTTPCYLRRRGVSSDWLFKLAVLLREWLPACRDGGDRGRE